MKKVTIICGTYGYRPDGAKRPKPVGYGGVVTVSDEEAERLVKLGVGKIMPELPKYPMDEAIPDVATPSSSITNVGVEDDKPSEENVTEGVGISDTLAIVDRHFTIDSLMTMTRANMEKLAADLGIDVSKCKNKSEIASLLAEVELDADEESETPPDLGAEAPVE